MTVHNADIAAVFQQIADLLEIQAENPFRIRAYRNAARQIEAMGVAVADMVAEGEELTQLPGIGEDLAAKIKEVVETGSCGLLAELEQQLPPTVTELLKLPGIGPRRARALYRLLHVESLADLVRAARGGEIRRLPGFGVKTERSILKALEAHAAEAPRFLLATALQHAEPLRDHLARTSGVGKVVIAGSLRRAKETVGDLDILVTADESAAVMDRFAAFDEVAEVVARGGTRATVRLACGLQADLRVVDGASFGAALHYFTGSRSHNVQIRRLGQKAGLRINEYGVFRRGRRIAGGTEESVFKAVGLPYIPPELREDRGEIEAAQDGTLPKLVVADDLRGDLHSHTSQTDGRHSLQAMAEAAQARGLEYLAITDHSRRLSVARGLDPKRLRRQIEEIDVLNDKLNRITLLKGIEVEILEDGSLDLPDHVLTELDLVIGAVHSHFNLTRARQTTRILRAMDRRHFSILAHPAGRLLGEREAYDVDMERVIRQAKARGACLELNGQPKRLDLQDIYCQMAKAHGVLVAISSDAHGVEDFDNLKFGIGQARRGWLEKHDVLNTRSLAALRRLLRRTM